MTLLDFQLIMGSLALFLFICGLIATTLYYPNSSKKADIGLYMWAIGFTLDMFLLGTLLPPFFKG